MAGQVTDCGMPLGADQATFDVLMASADDVYFFDDLLPNVLAARAVGMRSFHVQGLAATVAALRDAGVNTDGYA